MNYGDDILNGVSITHVNKAMFLGGLPDTIPFSPNINVDQDQRQYVNLCLGHLLLTLQNASGKNCSRIYSFNFLSRNNYQNQEFFNILIETVILTEFIVNVERQDPRAAASFAASEMAAIYSSIFTSQYPILANLLGANNNRDIAAAAVNSKLQKHQSIKATLNEYQNSKQNSSFMRQGNQYQQQPSYNNQQPWAMPNNRQNQFSGTFPQQTNGGYQQFNSPQQMGPTQGYRGQNISTQTSTMSGLFGAEQLRQHINPSEIGVRGSGLQPSKPLVSNAGVEKMSAMIDNHVALQNSGPEYTYNVVDKQDAFDIKVTPFKEEYSKPIEVINVETIDNDMYKEEPTELRMYDHVETSEHILIPVTQSNLEITRKLTSPWVKAWSPNTHMKFHKQYKSTGVVSECLLKWNKDMEYLKHEIKKKYQGVGDLRVIPINDFFKDTISEDDLSILSKKNQKANVDIDVVFSDKVLNGNLKDNIITVIKDNRTAPLFTTPYFYSFFNTGYTILNVKQMTSAIIIHLRQLDTDGDLKIYSKNVFDVKSFNGNKVYDQICALEFSGKIDTIVLNEIEKRAVKVVNDGLNYGLGIDWTINNMKSYQSLSAEFLKDYGKDVAKEFMIRLDIHLTKSLKKIIDGIVEGASSGITDLILDKEGLTNNINIDNIIVITNKTFNVLAVNTSSETIPNIIVDELGSVILESEMPNVHKAMNNMLAMAESKDPNVTTINYITSQDNIRGVNRGLIGKDAIILS